MCHCIDTGPEPKDDYVRIVMGHEGSVDYVKSSDVQERCWSVIKDLQNFSNSIGVGKLTERNYHEVHHSYAGIEVDHFTVSLPHGFAPNLATLVRDSLLRHHESDPLAHSKMKKICKLERGLRNSISRIEKHLCNKNKPHAQLPIWASDRLVDECLIYLYRDDNETLNRYLVGGPFRQPTFFPSDRFITELCEDAVGYLHGFKHLPVQEVDFNNGRCRYGDAIRYKLNNSSVGDVCSAALKLCDNESIRRDIVERILMNPRAVAKIACIREHASMHGASTPDAISKLTEQVILAHALPDALLRYIRAEFPGREDELRDSPQLYAAAALTHRSACKLMQVDPYDTTAQCRDSGALRQRMQAFFDRPNDYSFLKGLVGYLRDPTVTVERGFLIGESLFFQKPPDSSTYSLYSHIFDCFERGVRNVEIPLDLLPFDPSKRLPGEISSEEAAQVRELARILGLTLTVHSPIVGPIHDKNRRTALFEDPADNLPLLQATIDTAERLGAKTVVVHLANRLDRGVLDSYADLVIYATKKLAADGTPLRLAFENYMQIQAPDNRGVVSSAPEDRFPTWGEYVSCFEQILKSVLKKSIESSQDPVLALYHCTMCLDSAHFNLVGTLAEDPVKCAMQVAPSIRQMMKSLLIDSKFGQPLSRAGFEPDKLGRFILSELHLNQNFGPITPTNPDHSSDLHLPISAAGTIDTVAFVTVLLDSGVLNGSVILAEQKSRLEPEDIQLLCHQLRDLSKNKIAPGPKRVRHFIDLGREALTEFESEEPARAAEVVKFLKTSDRHLHVHYAYMAGRFGPYYLLTHLERRILHHLFSGHVDTNAAFLSQLPPKYGAVVEYKSGARIAEPGGHSIVLRGSASITRDGRAPLKVPPGLPVRDTVCSNSEFVAGPDGATVLRVPAEVVSWMLFLCPELKKRLEVLFARSDPRV